MGSSRRRIFDYSRLVTLDPTGFSYQLLGHAYELAHSPTDALTAYRFGRQSLAAAERNPDSHHQRTCRQHREPLKCHP
jgi:hypothetical protein